jgi:hypothetical protein
LAAELRAAGLPVVEDAGWQGRGGDLTPLAVIVHHTASGPASDPTGDVNYICRTGPLVPEYNAFVSRSGTVYVCAAGSCNHAGKGGAWRTSSGATIPQDSANSRTVAVVGANGGTGEPWPMVQQENLVAVAATVCRVLGIRSADVIAHFEWCAPSCPGRKIDPAGNSQYASGGSSWNMDAFRSDVADVGTTGGDDVAKALKLMQAAGDDAVWQWDGQTKVLLPDAKAVQVAQFLTGLPIDRLDPATDLRCYGPVVGPQPAGRPRDPYGVAS